MIKIYCDGSYRENMPDKPGFAAFIAWEDDCEIKRWKGRVEVGDSSQAELLAITKALYWAADKNKKSVQIYTDNKIVVEILTGKTFSEKYKKLSERILILKYQYFDEVLFNWVPRGHNELADSLCKEAVVKHEMAEGYKETQETDIDIFLFAQTEIVIKGPT